MRFTSIFLALPLVASVFAAPLAPEVPSLPAAVETLPIQDLDIHAVTLVGNTSTEIEVRACLEAVVLAFDQCGQALGIDISLGVDVEIELEALVATDGELEIVAELLADVVEVVHGLVGGLDSAICLLPTIAALLHKVDCAVGAIVIVLDHLLDGLFDLLSGLLSGVGLDLGGLFGGLMGAAKGGLGILGL